MLKIRVVLIIRRKDTCVGVLIGNEVWVVFEINEFERYLEKSENSKYLKLGKDMIRF